MPRLFMGNTCNFSRHKQRRIYQLIINLKQKKHPCKPAIANDFKLYETNRGKGLTNGRGAIPVLLNRVRKLNISLYVY